MAASRPPYALSGPRSPARDVLPARDLAPGQAVYVPGNHPFHGGDPATVTAVAHTHYPKLRRVTLDVEGRDGPLEVMTFELRSRSQQCPGVGKASAAADCGAAAPRGEVGEAGESRDVEPPPPPPQLDGDAA